MAQVIWIVGGSTGEYSDRTEWTERAYTTEAAAQSRIARLDALMQELNANGEVDYDEREAAVNAMRAHVDGDPRFRCDYTGSSYGYCACELVA